MQIYVSLANYDELEDVRMDEDGDASSNIEPDWQWLDTEEIALVRKYNLGKYVEVWNEFNLTSGNNVIIPLIKLCNGHIYGVMEDYDSFMEKLKVAPLEDIKYALRDIASSLKTEDYYGKTNNVADILKGIRSNTDGISSSLSEGIVTYKG